MRFPTKEFVTLVLSATLLACGDSPSTPAIAAVSSITVGLAQSTLIAGSSTTVSAETYNSDGQVIRGRAIEYSSSNSAVASINSSSTPTRVIGIAPGTATISASSERKTATAIVTVSGPTLCGAESHVARMSVGQVINLSAAQKALLCLGASTDAMEFKLVVAGISSASTVTLASNNAIAVVPTAQSAPVSDAFTARQAALHDQVIRTSARSDVDHLRSPFGLDARREKVTALRARSNAEIPVVGAIVTLNGLSNDDCAANPRSARVVGVGKYIIMYADVALPSGGFNELQYASLVATFDTLVFPLDTLSFGSPKDLDGNGRIAVYLLPDFPSATINASVRYRDFESVTLCAGSNAGEYMYITPPDPNVAGASTVLETMTLLPEVMAHELQHIINGTFHIPTYEEIGLNEGLSHIAEELYFYRITGLQARSNYSAPLATEVGRNAINFMSRDFSYYELYLQRPEQSSPLGTVNSVQTRGAMWNLLRYASDRKGGNELDTWRALAGTTRTGVDNLTRVFGTFQSQLRDWAVSNVTDDVVPNISALYTFPSWNIRSFQTGTTLVPERNLVGDPFTVQLVPYGTSYHQFRVAAGTIASIRTSSAGAATTVDVMVVRTK